MKRFKLSDITGNGLSLLPAEFGGRTIVYGGLHMFQPGEIAHPEPVHVHDTAEVFIFLQGKGVLPIDGIEHPIQTGDVVIVDAGEDHHTRSSIDAPLVAAWYVMSK